VEHACSLAEVLKVNATLRKLGVCANRFLDKGAEVGPHLAVLCFVFDFFCVI
jgi:hypothetical protein